MWERRFAEMAGSELGATIPYRALASKPRASADAMQIEHIIFLIHPCCYEPIDAETIRRDGFEIFLEREEQVKVRWLEELAQCPQETLYVQLGGPDYLRDAAAAALGESQALSLKFPFPGGENLHAYYEGLTDEIETHLKAHDLPLDKLTVTSELWGESFEGCVPGYGGAFAQYLGLTCAPRMRFEMTVYDARFLFQARHVETIPIAGTDVEAWLFECHDGTSAATFQPRQTAQWLDERQLILRLHDKRHQLTDKQGHTVWPDAPWSKGKPELEHDVCVPMKDWVSRWARGIGTDLDSFRAIVAAARVE